MEKLTALYRNKNIRTVAVVILTVFAAVSLVQGCRNAVRSSQDFQWDAAKALTLRIDPYDESLSPSGILDKYGFETYYLQMEANQFPSLLMLLIPYTFMPPLAARYAWLISNLVFTGLIIVLLRKTFLKDADGFDFTILVLLMISGTPYRNQLGVGQHTLFAFCFFLLAVYLSEYAPFLEGDGHGIRPFLWYIDNLYNVKQLLEKFNELHKSILGKKHD